MSVQNPEVRRTFNFTDCLWLLRPIRIVATIDWTVGKQIPPIRLRPKDKSSWCDETNVQGQHVHWIFSWQVWNLRHPKLKLGGWTKYQPSHLPLSSVWKWFHTVSSRASRPLTTHQECRRERERENKVAHTRRRNLWPRLSEAKSRLRGVIRPSTSRDRHGWGPYSIHQLHGSSMQSRKLSFLESMQGFFFWQKGRTSLTYRTSWLPGWWAFSGKRSTWTNFATTVSWWHQCAFACCHLPPEASRTGISTEHGELSRLEVFGHEKKCQT